MKLKDNIKVKFAALSLLFSITFLTGGKGYGYIMPAEQLLDFMVNNFSKLKTVSIVQSTLQVSDGREKVFKEQIWLKSPDLYNLKVIDRAVERTRYPDMAYLQLLIANSRWRIERLLSAMDVNIKSVAFTRLDGVIAYRIGEKEGPRLLIEKERFIPLLLEYRMAENVDGDMVTIRFQDYREQGNNWFPFEVTYSEGNMIKERYTVQTFEYNIPVGSALMKHFQLIPAPEHETENIAADDEEDRPKNIIRAFEEKYQ